MAQFSVIYGDWLDQELGSDDRTTLFTTQRRKDAVNEAQREFNRAAEVFVRQGSITLSDNVAEYDLEAQLTDFLDLSKQGIELAHVTVGGQTTYYAGDDLLRRDIEWLNRFESGWRGASKGKPTKFYVRRNGGQVFLGFTPPPQVGAGETFTATVPYVADVPDMSSDADLPFTLSANQLKVLIPYHRALAKHAAYTLEQLRKNFGVAEKRLIEFNAFVAAWIQAQRPRGGQHVLFGRQYRREVRGGMRAVDWRRFP